MNGVIVELTTTRGRLPTEAIQWALDNWREAAPRFVAALERWAGADETSEDAEHFLFLAIHMLAEKRETTAFKPLCRLLRNTEAMECILGDAIGETLSQLLISLHDGDWPALRSLIEDPEVDEFVRHAALNAWAYFTSTGAIDVEATRRYLQSLAQTMQPLEPTFAWTGIADAIILLGLNDLRPLVQDLMRRELISPSDLNLKDFDSAMKQALADPEAAFNADRVYPFGSTIAEFSDWHWASEATEEDEDWVAAQDTESELAGLEGSYLNPLRHVGRNDPCPCGSGKKYKKCCLV